MDWTGGFRALSGMACDARERLRAGAKLADVPAGEVIFGPENETGSVLLLLEGTMRVQQSAGNGRSVVLFRVPAGEACVMPTTYQAREGSNVARGVSEGVAETAVRVAVVPRVLCDQLMGESAQFRELIVATYTRRLVQIGAVLEEVVFHRVDSRLSQRLLKLADEEGMVRATHHDLAAELGTAREVISRQLKEFRRRGWIAGGRGEVRIIAPGELEKLAHSA